ncbi:MAG: D-alanyl-D-alanine carboxypeptidase/D-alanyl-D-alanine-endopeptidase [Acidobacteriota bacterium]|nr:D-alanyl-D-alanine carboxypeptidase/D-alanyl-D-alanine-endopeptidase [Acidobacteriota bacterium]
MTRCASRRRMKTRTACLLAALLLCLAPRAGQPLAAEGEDAVEALRRDLSAIFTERRMADAQWGVQVYSLDRGEALFEHNARKLYTPASNVKLLTAAAALWRLDPKYRFKTKVFAAGAIEGGVLRGDLVIQGFGDPSASPRMKDADGKGMAEKDYFAVFREWAGRLKERGVRAISGRIVGDATAFTGGVYGRGWEWDDLFEGYAAPVSALQFNENFVSLDVKPGAKAGAPALTRQEPLPGYLRVEGGVTTRAQGAKGAKVTAGRARPGFGSASGATIGADGAQGVESVRIDGEIPLKGAAFNQQVAVERPVRYYLEALKHLLGREGVDVSGCPVEEASAPESATLLWTHESPPLGELLVPIMKESLNLPAEAVLRAMGREAYGTASAADGARVVEDMLTGVGVPKGSYVYADASGLSRRNLVSADILVKVLGFMHRQPTFPRFYASLAVAGTDGTLKNRLKKTVAEGNVRAKTGTMSGVSAISGYMKTNDGELLAFSMIANNYPFSKAAAEEAQNRALTRLAAFSRK